MALFQDTPADWQRLDWKILRNGWASLYYRPDVLEKDIEWFKTDGFAIFEFDCSTWVTDEDMHNELQAKFDFPCYYGKNLDALNDCLSELQIGDAGHLVVFRNFDVVEAYIAFHVVDILAHNARDYMLIGKKLITLVQVNEPKFSMAPVGACSVLWNGAEWMDATRRR